MTPSPNGERVDGSGRTPARVAVAAGLLTLAACRGFTAPSPELMEKLNVAQAAESPYVREKVNAKIASPWITGEFDGIILAKTGPSPCVRMQLFPEVGGRVIDLLARPDRVAGYMPQTGQGADHPLPLRGKPDAIHVLGILLLEHYAGRLGDRAAGMREREDGWEVLVRPAAEAFDVVLTIGRDGRVRRRRFEWTWYAGWDQVIESDGQYKLEIRDVSLRIRTIESKPLPQAAESLFELKLPEDVKPLEWP